MQIKFLMRGLRSSVSYLLTFFTFFNFLGFTSFIHFVLFEFVIYSFSVTYFLSSNDEILRHVTGGYNNIKFATSAALSVFLSNCIEGILR